jgi:hypothetical protein
MASKGNGQQFKISFSGLLAPELKKLHERAKEAGLGDAYLNALETAVFRMEHDPWEFGELIREVKKPPLKVHVAVVKPLVIEFSIHTEKPIVFIKRIRLLT